MKPFFMQFKQPGEYGQYVWINMNQVCHMMPYGERNSMFTFCAVLNGTDPAYLVVEGTPTEHWNRIAA